MHAFHTRLSSLNVPLANTPTVETANLATKRQEWVLLNRLKEILKTGALCVGSSQGFTQQSAFLHIGCRECGAALHISCPCLNGDGCRSGTPSV